MNLQQFTLDIYNMLYLQLEQTIKGLTPEQLNYQPKPESNSIGWLIWHATRSQDRMNADLFGEDQLWISAKWHVKFNRLPDPKETGNGHTPAQLAAFRVPDAQTLSNYYKAVFEKTQLYINTRLTESDLQREVYSPTFESTTTVERRILGTINNLQHIGQAGYVRGLLSGIGWYGR
ncbi:MAG: DinB family protein [Dehalococcoidales bacterium]|nr:DinB family protein [Dehalococcoidales bacterium]